MNNTLALHNQQKVYEAIGHGFAVSLLHLQQKAYTLCTMDVSTEQQIELLRIEIGRAEKDHDTLESEVTTLRSELAAFKARYDDLVQPLQERLDVVKSAITNLEQDKQAPLIGAAARLNWGDHPTVEEQFRRAWIKNPSESDQTFGFDMSAPALADPVDPTHLRSLYRRLARRYHPDFATDDDDRRFRTEIMSQINTAYSDADLAALLALDAHEADAEMSVAMLLLEQLQHTFNGLRNAIFALKQQKQELMNSDLMRLKIEESLMRAAGRNLLEELAAEIETEYRRLLKRLYDLRCQT